MNCDEAFEFLTDPTLRNSPRLQEHLDHCRRCRQMRETLAPAIDLFDSVEEEVLPAFERSSEPNQSGREPFLTPEAVRIAQGAAQNIRVARLRKKSSLKQIPTILLRHAVVFLLGLSLAYATFGLASGQEEPRQPLTTPLVADTCTWKNPDAIPSSEDPTARAVILSCVDCHLGRSLE